LLFVRTSPPPVAYTIGVLPGFVSEKFEALVQPVPPTPGVNASVPLPANGESHEQPPLGPGHWLDDSIQGRAAGPLEAMLDPEGMKDRRAAEGELAGRFEIVDGKKKGPRLPNQVTSAEFHQLANTYSDVRRGRGDLTLDPASSKNPAQFRADMMDDVADMLQTKSGRELVEGLSNNTHGVDANGNPVHHHTTLSPDLDPGGNPNEGNAHELGADQRIGVTTRKPDHSPGTGTDTTVSANPNQDVVIRDGDREIARGRSDVVEFHEMVHAYTDTQGISATGFVAETDGPGADVDAKSDMSRVEHQAAGLGLYANDRLTENAYRAERHELGASGRGIAGDLLMPHRENYNDVETYNTIAGR
jgi:Effector protein